MITNVFSKDGGLSEREVEFLRKKVRKFEKYENIVTDSAVCDVEVKFYPKELKVSVTLRTWKKDFNSSVRTNKLEDAINGTTDKIIDQLRREKTKLTCRKVKAVRFG